MATTIYDRGPTQIEGVLSSGSNILFTSPAKYITTITLLRFNNASAYDITLQMYDANLATTTDIYTYTLSAGDTITDITTYQLYPGDQVIADLSAGSTNYMMSYISYQAVLP